TLALGGVPLPGASTAQPVTPTPWSARIEGALDGRLLNGAGKAVHAELQLALTRFDPLPWWPGTPDSAWARGPHRFNGRWQIDAQLPESLGDQLRKDLGAALASTRGQAQIDIDDSQLAGVPIAASVGARGDGHTFSLAGRA